jgi:hypothetical protein
MLGNILGAVAGAATSKLLGGGKTSGGTQNLPGVEFQPFTYRGATGGVTGTPAEDGYGYDWSADISPWISDLGALGSAEAGGLFQKYLSASQVDPYAAAEEYYSRGLGVLEPEIAKQRTALGGSLFGSGRLGLKLAGEGLGYGSGAGAVNPDIAGFGAGVGKAYTDLYANALTAGQNLQTGYINQLSNAAQQMFKLGMTPAEVEQNLINFSAELEKARSNARKQGVQAVAPRETTGSLLAGQIAPLVSQGVSNWISDGDSYFGGQVGNVGFGPATDQSWSSYGQNLAGGGLWSGGSNYGDYYDPMNDFYA